MPPSLVFTEESWEEFKIICEKAYPNEGCGFLAGRLAAQSKEKKVVQKIVELTNTFLAQGRGRFDFAFSPKEFMERTGASQHPFHTGLLDALMTWVDGVLKEEK